MKYLVAFSIMLLPTLLFTQVFTGNVTFTTNADVAAFGAGNYQTINGDMNIMGIAISDLSPLASLTTINGNLKIGESFQNQVSLFSLDGLHNVVSITGNLEIVDIASLSSLMGLSNLASVGGNILIHGLGLTSMNGMPNLQTLNGDFLLESLSQLNNLDGFPSSLSTIGGAFIIKNSSLLNVSGVESINIVGSLLLSACHDLNTLQAFSNLTTVNNDLQIIGCVDLPNYAGLENVSHIGGTLELGGNDLINNFSPFSGMTTLGGILNIYQHSQIADLSDFSNLTSIGGLFLSSNDALTSLNGLQNLTISGMIQISFNDALIDLTGLSGISAFDGIFSIIENDGLTSLNGFPTNVTELAALRIDDNALLDDLTALSNIQQITGPLEITENATLSQLDGLEGITTIDDFVIISENLKLQNIAALNNLTSVGLHAQVFASGKIEIADNPKLTSLPLWNNLSYVRNSIFIINNKTLASISGASSLEEVENLIIRDNENLITISNYLNGLEKVEADLEIKNNEKLTSISGFQSLAEVGEDMLISDSPLLNSLTGFTILKDIGVGLTLRNLSLANLDNFTLLENLQAISIASIGGLTNLNGLSNTSALSLVLNVTNNTALSDCSGVCQHLDNENIQINIFGNLSPCDSPINLEGACAPPPVNDECDAAIGLTVSVNNDCNSLTSGTTFAATESLSGCNFEMDPIQDVWYAFTATENTHKVKITNLTALTGNFGSVLIELYSGACNSLTSISQCQRFINDESYAFSGLTPNTNYYLRVYTDNLDGPADFSICVQTPNLPANDEPANAVILTQGEICNSLVAGTVEDATETAPNAQMCNGNFTPQALDVWYRFTASTAAATFTVEPEGMTFAPVIELFEGDPNTYVTCNYMNAPGTAELQMSNLNIGNTYYIRVFHGDIQILNGTEASFNVCLHQLPTILLGQTFGNDCASASVSHQATGSGVWLHFNYFGQLIFSIQDTEAMGTITAEFYTHSTGIRTTTDGQEVLNRNFEISPTNDPINPVPVRFYITLEEFNDLVAANDGDNNDINSLSDFVIMRYSGVDCANAPLNGGIAHPVTGWGDLGMNAYYLDVAFADFSSFFLTGGANALPVELIEFKGLAQPDHITLSWATARETNHAYFEVEYSLNAVDFYPLEKIDQAETEGLTKRYIYHHDDPSEGINYYRLKQVDRDGWFESSPIIAINFDDHPLKTTSFHPNPAMNQIHFTTPMNGTYSIVNILGETLEQGPLSDTESLHIHQLNPGRYYLIVEAGNQVRRYFSFVKM